MKSSIKVPQTLTRAATVTITGEGSEKEFSMSISSDEPYKRYDWWNDKEYFEVLDHGPGGLDDSRMKSGLPILFNHDRDQHLGRAMTHANDGKKCTVGGMIWSESEFAQTKKKDALSGALPDTSVGYRLMDEGKQIGVKDGIPILKFKWAIHEASLVTIPADLSVGVGRSAEETARMRSMPHDVIAIDLQKGIDGERESVQTQANRNNSMAASTEELEAERQKIEVVRETARKEGQKAEQERTTGIQGLEKHFREKGLGGRLIETSELAGQFIREGKTVREFQDAVVMGNFKEVKAVETNPNVGMTERDLSAYSIVRAIRCLSVRGGVLDGLEGEMSIEAAKKMGQAQTPTSFFIPFDVMRAPQAGTKGHALSRALATNVFSAAGALVGNDLLGGSMIELLRNKMRVLALGAKVLSGLVGNIDIPMQTGGATASWLSETATVTESNQTVGQLQLTPHRLSAATAFTNQLLAQASVDVENFVRSDLMTVIAIARDLAAIAGTGNAGQPLGILNTSNLSTSVTFAGAQTMLYSDALIFENNVAINNADEGSLAYLTTPTVRKNAKAIAEISAANSNPVWKDDKVNGYTAKATNQVPTATSVIFGNWADVILADWAANQIIVDPYSLSLQGQVRIVMHQLADNGLRHSKSFSVSTN